MYNNPGRCAVNMSIDTIVNLAKLGGMALKDSDPNLARVTVLAEVVPDLKLLSGDDPTLPGYLAHGGHGCISVTANIAPALVKKLITSWQYRDIETMQETGKKLAKLSEALFVESNPIPAKYILSKMGYVANELRSPLTPASLQTQQKINQDYTFWYDIQTTRQ
ncbi:MAG: dihydrodipicolinate synthase family protein, partial [Holosporales bacterium]|jgi:4-hydroxy-tetrahydrodipicolinate synthase|nr:dihydrodipicolinate synthase family protein [Holosporales bacterium]